MNKHKKFKKNLFLIYNPKLFFYKFLRSLPKNYPKLPKNYPKNFAPDPPIGM